MAKGKPRHNPDKPQNKYGAECPLVEEIPQPDGSIYLHCECMGIRDISTKVCKGNRHNCVKTYLHREASKSDVQKINDLRRIKYDS